MTNHIIYSEVRGFKKHIFYSLCSSENGTGFVWFGNGLGYIVDEDTLVHYEIEKFGCDYCYNVVFDSFVLPGGNNLWFEDAK